MVLHHVFRARGVRRNGIGGEVRHGVTSGVSRETSLNKHVTPQLYWGYHLAALTVWRETLYFTASPQAVSINTPVT